MTTISSSQARAQWNRLLTSVATTKKPYIIETHGKGIAMLIHLPVEYSRGLSDVTNMALYGGALDWLAEEPDIYSINDAVETYV